MFLVNIGSNGTKLKFGDVVSSLLSEENRRKNMDSQSMDALSVRGHSLDRNKNNSSSGRSKSRGRSKSPRNSLRECWKCGKIGHYKKDCRSKIFERGNGSNDVPSIEGKTSSEDGLDVYLASSSTHVDHDVWMINLCASFHMTPHKQWFCENETYNGGDIFLGDHSTAKIIGQGKFNLSLKDGRIRTLLGVFYIPKLAINLIYVSKTSDAGVHTVFEKETYKMV
jgi:hypothetical protein